MSSLAHFYVTATKPKIFGSKTGAKLGANRRQMIVTLAERLVSILREEAPKKTGIFAAGIRSGLVQTAWGETMIDVDVQGEHARVTGGGKSYPLAQLIVKGTKPHLIPKGGSAEMQAKGYPLRFYWEKGPHGPGIYRFWSVHHPGTQPNPFIDRAIARWRPDALAELKAVGRGIGSGSGSVIV